MPQHLPTHPNLYHLKKQAKDVLRVFRRQNPRWKLADAQRAIARGYGFVNWPSLKIHVEKVRNEPAVHYHAAKTPLNRAQSSRDDCSIHPIVGTWVADRVKCSTHSDPQPPNEEIVVEFELSGEEIKLIQVATDPTGHEIAITTTIYADGHEHPVPFGEGVRLSARWTTSLMLEATFTTGQSLNRWSYEVTPDGKSLVISTTEQEVIFKRPAPALAFRTGGSNAVSTQF